MTGARCRGAMQQLAPRGCWEYCATKATCPSEDRAKCATASMQVRLGLPQRDALRMSAFALNPARRPSSLRASSGRRSAMPTPRGEPLRVLEWPPSSLNSGLRRAPHRRSRRARLDPCTSDARLRASAAPTPPASDDAQPSPATVARVRAPAVWVGGRPERPLRLAASGVRTGLTAFAVAAPVAHAYRTWHSRNSSCVGPSTPSGLVARCRSAARLLVVHLPMPARVSPFQTGWLRRRRPSSFVEPNVLRRASPLAQLLGASAAGVTDASEPKQDLVLIPLPTPSNRLVEQRTQTNLVRPQVLAARAASHPPPSRLCAARPLQRPSRTSPARRNFISSPPGEPGPA